MPGLEVLILHENLIQNVHQNAFSPLINLKYIDLSVNEFEQLFSLMFITNVHLRTVLINDNPKLKKKLPTEGFQIENGAFVVTSFDATNCSLTELSVNTFTTMPMLTELYLSLNKVLGLPNNIFSCCKNLTELDLRVETY